MTEPKNTMTSILSTLLPLAAASALTLACMSAQAALVNYTGLVDSGPLIGSSFSGSFSYADPAPLDDFVLLDSFELNFEGLTYTLASADAAPVAWFGAGNFLGIDYMDLDSFGIAVQMTAGFFDLSEALFSYDTGDTNGQGQGLGGFTSFSTVPEPGTLGLVLAGLLFARRKRQS